MNLRPCVIFSSGVAGTGKTTVCKALTENVDNLIYLDRDDINQANLFVSRAQLQDLPQFESYVVNDRVSLERVVTPFGEMSRIKPEGVPISNASFYKRHLRDQSYLVQGNIAKTNLNLGKAVIIDCITMRQIQDGTLRKFMEYQLFDGFPKHLIHFCADEEKMYQRVLERAKTDPYASQRIEVARASSPESFHKFITEEQAMVPRELNQYEHVLINTSEGSPRECAKKCIEYILARM